MNSSDRLDPILPFQFYPERHEAMLEAMKEVRIRSGIRRFLLTGPGLSVRLTGFPKMTVYRELGDLVLQVKQALSPHGIEVGWWCAPTLKSGQGGFQNIVGLNGQVSPISSCPLDVAFRTTLARGIAVVAERARPFMLQLEDDFELSNHPGVGFGCFCPLHLAEFAVRCGRLYSREQLADLFSRCTSESMAVRRQWFALSRASLVDLAVTIEQAVHAVSPETRLALCQPGCADLDGDMTEPVTQALAGVHRPAVRICGAAYSSDTARGLPEETFNVMFSCEQLPETFELFYETDTYPHTTFFTSANKLHSMLAIALSCGCDDSLFYGTQYLDDPLEDVSYLSMYAERASQLGALRLNLRDCRLIGCEVVCRSDAVNAVAWNGGRPSLAKPWAGVLGRYGVPYTTRSGKGVKVLAGATASVLTEADVKHMLTGGILMDAPAAMILAERGFGDLLGATVESGGKAAFCYERLRPKAGDEAIKGELIYNFLFAPAGAEAGGFCRLTAHPGAEVLSDFLAPDYQAVQPGLLRFENRLGGRVGILAYDLQKTQSSSIFCYRKRGVIVRLLEWLNRAPLPVKVLHDPNVFLLANFSESGALILTIVNLSADSRASLKLDVAPGWRDGRVSLLSLSGKWETVAAAWQSTQVEVEVTARIMQPVYVRLEQPRVRSGFPA